MTFTFRKLAREPKTSQGFSAAFKDSLKRQERDLGANWIGVSDAKRAKEARRRALNEWARRIGKRTGKKPPAISTLERKASKDELPRGADARWVSRWAQIDRAGGIEALAERFGRSPKQLAAWRDKRDVEPEPPVDQKAGGFAAALQDLVARQERDLGANWIGVSDAKRAKEARRRALNEWARRIGKRTGKKPPAISTLERKASKDELPRGADARWVSRWAQIDRAGGIEALAQQSNRTAQQLATWRDGSAEPPPPEEGQLPWPVDVPLPSVATPEAEGQLSIWQPGEFDIGVECDGWLVIDGEIYDKHLPADTQEEYEWLEADWDTYMAVNDAHEAGDTDTLHEILSRLITDQVLPEWENLKSGSWYNVSEVLEIVFPDSEG